MALAALLVECSGQSPPGSSPNTSLVTPAQLFDRPPAWPGYHWTYGGRTVGWEVIASAAGPSHCSWEAAAMLTLGWPPGTASATAAHSRQYLRDPQNVLRTRSLLATLDLHARLPADARPTGLRYQGVEVYVSPAEVDRDVYVVGAGVVERWPRSDPMTVCS
jgi:hypothetical protein